MSMLSKDENDTCCVTSLTGIQLIYYFNIFEFRFSYSHDSDNSILMVIYRKYLCCFVVDNDLYVDSDIKFLVLSI